METNIKETQVTRRADPAEDALERIRHDVQRLGHDARRDMSTLYDAAQAMRSRLVDYESAAAELRTTFRRAQRPKYEPLPANVHVDFDHRGRPVKRPPALPAPSIPPPSILPKPED